MPHYKFDYSIGKHRYGQYNRYKKTMALSVLLLSGMVIGCDRQNSNAQQQAVEDGSSLQVFAGCYTVTHGEPAQIKVSQQADGWVMQMKEPARAHRVWDDPEPLQVIDKKQLGKYFSIDGSHVTAMLGRPDKVLVLAHVTDAYANIDPLLDSQFLAHIYQGANTIYKVDCDNTNTDILADPHANIVIEHVEPTSDPIINDDIKSDTDGEINSKNSKK